MIKLMKVNANFREHLLTDLSKVSPTREHFYRFRHKASIHRQKMVIRRHAVRQGMDREMP
jgi:hypothetical protein